MLKCSNLKKKYYKKTAVENITLELEAGRIYALLGPNGSGKTTFMKAVAGLVKPTEGTVLYKGQSIGVASKKEVSYMPTEDYFYPYMTVEDVGKYYQDFFADFNFDTYKTMVEDMGVGLRDKMTKISTGMAAKVRLAAALSRKAKLYLLDEPEAALSYTNQLALIYLMQEAVSRNSQFIIATHSPILMAYPGAALYEMQSGSLTRKTYCEMDSIRFLRRFLNDPDSLLCE